MVLLRKCCCCIGLRTGGIIIGWLSLISAITGIVSAIIRLASPPPEEIMKSIHGIKIGDEVFDFNDRSTNDFQKMIERYTTSILVSMLISELIHVVISGCLIWGAHMRKKLFIIPYLATNGLRLLVITLIIIAFIIIGFIMDVRAGIILMCVGLPTAALCIYIWCCILALYQKLRDEELLNVRRRQEEMSCLNKGGSVPEKSMTSHQFGGVPPAYNTVQNV